MTRRQAKDRTSITVSKLYNASQQEVFAAWIERDTLAQWMCPEGGCVSFAAVDARVGGAYRIDMQFGNEVIVHRGVYREIVPPEKLVFTWVSVNTHQQETLVTVELVARGTQTELVLTHEHFPSEESAQAHTAGWQGVLSMLEKLRA